MSRSTISVPLTGDGARVLTLFQRRRDGSRGEESSHCGESELHVDLLVLNMELVANVRSEEAEVRSVGMRNGVWSQGRLSRLLYYTSQHICLPQLILAALCILVMRNERTSYTVTKVLHTNTKWSDDA